MAPISGNFQSSGKANETTVVPVLIHKDSARGIKRCNVIECGRANT